jgi:hypothetical protein
MLKAMVFAAALIVSAAGFAQDTPNAADTAARPEGEAQQRFAEATPPPAQTLAADVQASQSQTVTQSSSSEPPAPADAAPGVKVLSGMSILGNEEAPKSLVIVPWKSSQLGDEVGIRNDLDDRALPVDREVFMREVHYFDLRSGSSP